MGLSRQEYWSGLSFPSPGDLPDPGIEPRPPGSPELQADSLLLSHWESQKERMWLPLTCCCLCLGSSSGHPGPDREEELLITDGFIFKSTKSQNKWTVGKEGITFNSGSVTGLL